jgi:hypothetical protein
MSKPPARRSIRRDQCREGLRLKGLLLAWSRTRQAVLHQRTLPPQIRPVRMMGRETTRLRVRISCYQQVRSERLYRQGNRSVIPQVTLSTS